MAEPIFDPSRAVLDEEPIFDPSRAIAEEEPEKSVFVEGRDQVIGFPDSYNADEMQYTMATEIDRKDKRNFFGMLEFSQDLASNLGKGFANFFVSSPQTGGSLLKEGGEVGLVERNKGDLEADISSKFMLDPGELAGFIGRRTSEALQIPERLKSAGQKLIDMNKKFVDQLAIKPTSEEGPQKTAFDLGTGLGSIGASIGLTVLTKKPELVALLFGGIQKAQIYEEGRAKGLSPEKASIVSTAAGTAESALEFVGLHVFFETIKTSRKFAKIALRSATEAIQEGSQQAAEESITALAGIREDKVEDIVKRIGYATAIGFVAGFPVSAIVTMAERQGVIEELKAEGKSEEEAKDIVKAVSDNQVKNGLIDQVAQTIENETSQINMTSQERTAAFENLQKEIKGIPAQEDSKKTVAFTEIEGVKLADIPSAKSNIEKGFQIIKDSEELTSQDLFKSEEVDFEQAKKMAEEYYFSQLYGTSVISPALNNEKVVFDQEGFDHVIEGIRGEGIKMPNENIKRRAKFFPKVKELIEKAQVVESIKSGEDKKTFSLLGKFKDGSVLRVVLQETEKGGKRFFSVFDVEDLSKRMATYSVKKITQDSSSGLGSTSQGYAVDEGPSSKGVQNIAQQKGPVNDLASTLVNPEGLTLALPEIDLEFLNPGIEKGRKAVSSINKTLEKILAPISTRLREIDESLNTALRKFEFDLGKSILKDQQEALPFLQAMAQMEEQDRSALDLALKNSDIEIINQIVNEYDIQEEYGQVRKLLDDLFQKAKDVGLEVNFFENYHPRMVKDSKGLLNYFGKQDSWSQMEEAIRIKEQQVGRYLTRDEKVAVINSWLRGYSGTITIAKPGNLKTRKIDVLTPELNEFYATSEESLINYIRALNKNIEVRRFFGKSNKAAGGPVVVDDSIAAYVLNAMAEGKIKPDQEQDVREILQARFKERGPDEVFSVFRNLAYIDTMGSPISAITQIGDLAFSLYKSGFYRTGKSLLKAIAGKSDIKKADLGIDKIAQEFSGNTSATAKAVEHIFKVIGLDFMDKLGKETVVNSAIDKYRAQAKNPSAGFTEKMNDIFGEETQTVIDELKSGQVSENIKFLAFTELADVQPIALSEMPEQYLTGGNGRIFYMLKTYTIKQFDVFRNEAFSIMRTNPLQGMKNLTRLVFLLILANAPADVIKNLLLNRPTNFPDILIDNIARLVGFSKFIVYKAREEGPSEALKSQLLPPMKAADNLIKDINSIQSGKLESLSQLELISDIPLIGKFYYWWFGKGAAKSEKKRNKEKVGNLGKSFN